VGQIELDVARAAQTTVVVLVPESGDAVQVMKAGLMEIGEVFCINKADRQGSDRLVVEVESMLNLRTRRDGWQPPVVRTVATGGEGLEELAAALTAHRRHLEESGLIGGRRREAVRDEIVELVEKRLRRDVWGQRQVAERLGLAVDEVLAGSSTPYRAADDILRMLQTN
jgi:LAO/AO transport system kinase